MRQLEEKLIKGAHVLKLGCGMGAITHYPGETAKEVVAVDRKQAWHKIFWRGAGSSSNAPLNRDNKWLPR